MKAVILAGGLGTRISEESGIRPKPLVEIGGMPILWHIMKIYSAHGINEFIICAGYKGHMIKEFFMNYALYRSDVTFDIAKHNYSIHKNGAEPWKVTVVDTGEEAMTGGRIKHALEYIEKNETFCCTYGDGLSDINITELIEFHNKHGKMATLTAVQPPGRWGAFTLGENEDSVTSFREKPQGDGAWVSGGFFVLNAGVGAHIEGDMTIWEQDPLKAIAHSGQLMAYKHNGFWQPMDTLRDKMVLEKMWTTGKAPWKVWK